MKPLLPILAAAVLAACAQTPAEPPPAALLQRVSAVAPTGCEAATARALANAGVTADQVDSLYYQPIMGGALEADMVVGYMAWTRIKDQPGHLVATMDTDERGSFCHLRSVYTRGGMALAGRPAS